MAAATAKIIGKCRSEQLVFEAEGQSGEEKIRIGGAKLHRVALLLVESSGSRNPLAPLRCMKPVPQYHQITDDLFIWHGYNPECKTDCSSTAIRTPDGFVLIDPVRLEEQAIERMVGDDRVGAVLLTNGNHLRGSLYEKERLDVPIYAPQGAREVPADYVVEHGELLFQTLKAVGLPGAGSGETAYLGANILVVGDALVNLDGLQILPEKYCENSSLLRDSLRVLPSLNFEIICFAHGLPIVGEAREKVAAIL
jgi:glyoxylase-like metal-dependent hydrolase (beta-lactamase superfamily II)